jgi:hypothetical protein
VHHLVALFGAHRLQSAGEHFEDAEPEHHDHVGHEEVGGNGEGFAGFLHAFEVAAGDDQEEEDGQWQHEWRQCGDGRRGGGGPGGGGHGGGEDVAEEEGDAGHLGPRGAEVVLGHDVGAAGAGICLDGLAVAEDQQDEHHKHGPREGEHVPEGGQGEGRVQHPEELLGGVRGGRQVVGGEHGQGGGLAQPLVGQLVGVEGWPEQLLLDPVAERLGQIDQVGLGLGDRNGLVPGGLAAREVHISCHARESTPS